VRIRVMTARVATLEKRRTVRLSSFIRGSVGIARNGPIRSTGNPSRPPIHTEAATRWSQSATNGRRCPSAAAWLCWVRVTSRKAATTAATHQ
jgi:hypothetical protein